MTRIGAIAAGAAAVAAITWLYHGPLGSGDRLAQRLETEARVQLDLDEMTRVTARVQRHPLTRRVILSGPADDFQRAEIKQRIEALPGIGEAAWDPASLEAETIR